MTTKIPKDSVAARDAAIYTAPLFTSRNSGPKLPHDLHSWSWRAKQLHTRLTRVGQYDEQQVIQLIALAVDHLDALTWASEVAPSPVPRDMKLYRLIASDGWGILHVAPGSATGHPRHLEADLGLVRQSHAAAIDRQQPTRERPPLIAQRRLITAHLQAAIRYIEREVLDHVPVTDLGARRWMSAWIMGEDQFARRAITDLTINLRIGAKHYLQLYTSDAYECALGAQQLHEQGVGKLTSEHVQAYLRAEIGIGVATPRGATWSVMEGRYAAQVILRGAAAMASDAMQARLYMASDLATPGRVDQIWSTRLEINGQRWCARCGATAQTLYCAACAPSDET